MKKIFLILVSLLSLSITAEECSDSELSNTQQNTVAESQLDEAQEQKDESPSKLSKIAESAKKSPCCISRI